MKKGNNNKNNKANKKRTSPKEKKVNKAKSGETSYHGIRHGDEANKATINGQSPDNSKEIINIAYIMIGLFVLVIGYFAFSLATKGEDIINNAYNQRQDLLAKQIVRGDIKSADGKTLAHTLTLEDESEVRVYPYSDMFPHVVGRFSKGRTGLEFSENFRLLTSSNNGFIKVFKDLTGQKKLGDSVVTTLDFDLQKAAYDGLGDNKGAVVVIEPSSGKILAMVSKPTYDPNKIDDNWEDVKDDNKDKPLMNRVTSEAYPPGSVFKLVTILEYIRQNFNYDDYSYECDGSFISEGVKITCYRAHGVVDLKKSLTVSCNTSLGNIGASLNPDMFKESVASLNLDTFLPEELDYNHPHTAIGQGDVRVSPMKMAEFVASIANGGVSMKPYMVDHIINSSGNIVDKFTPDINQTYLKTWEADVISQYMEEVILSGTATSLQSDKYSAAGKTGTAQNQKGNEPHSWFVGFANTNKAEIVISIIVENAGSSSKHAVPIAKDIFDTYYSNKDN